MGGGSHISLLFRVGNYLKRKPSFIAFLPLMLVKILYRFQQMLTGIQLPLETQVGPGIVFAHYSNIVIGGDVRIGSNCTIFQGVTIGSMRGIGGGRPVLGDNVIVFPGAKIIGNIKIGNNVIVGANAVVTKCVPDKAVVAGVPAKVISYKGEEIAKHYEVI